VIESSSVASIQKLTIFKDGPKHRQVALEVNRGLVCIALKLLWINNRLLYINTAEKKVAYLYQRIFTKHRLSQICVSFQLNKGFFATYENELTKFDHVRVRLKEQVAHFRALISPNIPPKGMRPYFDFMALSLHKEYISNPFVALNSRELTPD
jgi:hypothetical protein